VNVDEAVTTMFAGQVDRRAPVQTAVIDRRPPDPQSRVIVSYRRVTWQIQRVLPHANSPWHYTIRYIHLGVRNLTSRKFNLQRSAVTEK